MLKCLPIPPHPAVRHVQFLANFCFNRTFPMAMASVTIDSPTYRETLENSGFETKIHLDVKMSPHTTASSSQTCAIFGEFLFQQKISYGHG